MDINNIYEYEYECYGCEHCYFKHGFVKCDLNESDGEEYVQGKAAKEQRDCYCIKRDL